MWDIIMNNRLKANEVKLLSQVCGSEKAGYNMSLILFM